MKTYTFHISLPGFGRVWRKVELAADQTLEDLHFAIQNAYDWDAAHLYSFFMSGEAWDSSTEYCLPEEAFDLADDDPDQYEEWEDEEDEGDEGFEPEIDEATADSLRTSMGDQPPPQSFEEMLALLQTNEELRTQVKKMMSEQFGVPAFMADMVLGNVGALMGMFGEGLTATMPDVDDEEEAGDVRTTTLESLELQPDQSFLYLFDYGDEWQFNVRVHAVDENASSTIQYPRVVQIVGEAPPQYPDLEDEDEEEWEEDEDEEEWEEDEDEEDLEEDDEDEGLE